MTMDLRAMAPLRILVVDDDPVVREAIGGHYADLGFAVEMAEDGVAGLAAMERCRPDVVLCDRRMPKLSGADMLGEIRARGAEWQKVVFLFVTGLGDRRDRYAMLDLHPDGYIVKPFDFNVIDATIARALYERDEGRRDNAASPV